MLRGGFVLLLLFVVWEASAMRVGNFTPRFQPKLQEDNNEKAEERSSYSYVYLPSLGDSVSFYTKGQYQGSFYSLSVTGPDFSYLKVACNFRVAGGSYFTFSSGGYTSYYYCPARYWYCIWTIRSVARVSELTFRMYSWSEDWYMDAAECKFDVERGQESTTGFTASTTASTTTTPTTTSTTTTPTTTSTTTTPTTTSTTTTPTTTSTTTTPTTTTTTPTTTSTTTTPTTTTTTPTTTSTTTTPTTSTTTTPTTTTTTTTPSSANPNGPSILNTCECGKQSNTRIVGGNEAPDNKYPFIAQLSNNGNWNSFFCGGTVISDEYILTAAHCTEFRDKIYVLLGANNEDQSEGQQVPIRDIIDHPDYDSEFLQEFCCKAGQLMNPYKPDNNTNTLEYDISLLRLNSTIDFSSNDRIRPACLPRGSDSYEGTDATAIGWGTLSSGGKLSFDLMEVVLPIVSNSDCLAAYERHITENSICAGEKGKDACQGDSGGPLLHKNAGDFYDVIGVTSWGIGCAQEKYPGVWARVTAVVEWINDQIKESSTCTTPA